MKSKDWMKLIGGAGLGYAAGSYFNNLSVGTTNNSTTGNWYDKFTTSIGNGYDKVGNTISNMSDSQWNAVGALGSAGLNYKAGQDALAYQKEQDAFTNQLTLNSISDRDKQSSDMNDAFLQNYYGIKQPTASM